MDHHKKIFFLLLILNIMHIKLKNINQDQHHKGSNENKRVMMCYLYTQILTVTKELNKHVRSKVVIK